MNIQIYDSSESLTFEQLSAFEQKYQLELPDQYRRFLLRYNGGKPLLNTTSFFNRQWAERDYFLIFRFLNVGEGANSINNHIATFRDRIPTNLVPIANGVGRGLICIAHAGDDRGKVYFWDPNFEAGTLHEPTYENVYLISENFEEFLSTLGEETDADE